MSENSNGILLEAGTNEVEILVFTLGKLRCGVNVAKVREVVGQVEPVKVPQTHPAVVGCANLRGCVIPLIDLQLYFHPDQHSECEMRHIIITEFNNNVLGFVVDGVEQIFRLGWDAIEPMPAGQGTESAAVTSVCHIDNNLVLMIDFEKIALDVQGIDLEVRNVSGEVEGLDRSAMRVLLAEDSGTMRKFISETLIRAGYTRLVSCSDGAEAWKQIENTLSSPDAPPFDLLVSDIEMPQMDGLHLCKRIKDHPQLRDMPVVIFSSLVSDDNLKKTEVVGANATLTKPQLAELVKIVDGLLTRVEAVV